MWLLPRLLRWWLPRRRRHRRNILRPLPVIQNVGRACSMQGKEMRHVNTCKRQSTRGPASAACKLAVHAIMHPAPASSPHRCPPAEAPAPGSKGRCLYQAFRCRLLAAALAGVVASSPSRPRQAQLAAGLAPAVAAGKTAAGGRAAGGAAAGTATAAGRMAAAGPGLAAGRMAELAAVGDPAGAEVAPQPLHTPAAQALSRQTAGACAQTAAAYAPAVSHHSAAAARAAVPAAVPPQSQEAGPALADAACCWEPRAVPSSAAAPHCGCGCGHACCRAAGPCRCPSGGGGCAPGRSLSGCRCVCGCAAALGCCGPGTGCVCGHLNVRAGPCRGCGCGPCCGCGCGCALACCRCGGTRQLLWPGRSAACGAAWAQEKWLQPRRPLVVLPGWWGCLAGLLLEPTWLPQVLRHPAAAAAAPAVPAAVPPSAAAAPPPPWLQRLQQLLPQGLSVHPHARRPHQMPG